MVSLCCVRKQPPFFCILAIVGKQKKKELKKKELKKKEEEGVALASLVLAKLKQGVFLKI